MMNFRKISAASKGKLLLRYFTEDTPEPIHASPVDENGRNLDSGGRLTSYYTGRDGRATCGRICRPWSPMRSASTHE